MPTRGVSLRLCVQILFQGVPLWERYLFLALHRGLMRAEENNGQDFRVVYDTGLKLLTCA
jgi:hypothetical protein